MRSWKVLSSQPQMALTHVTYGRCLKPDSWSTRTGRILVILASAAEDLDYLRTIDDADIASLTGNDLFEVVEQIEEAEQRIVSTLARQVVDRTASTLVRPR